MTEDVPISTHLDSSSASFRDLGLIPNETGIGSFRRLMVTTSETPWGHGLLRPWSGSHIYSGIKTDGFWKNKILERNVFG
ncbi:hypothetical protein JTE90_012731 [Oedothorax gibbosus]|uniref:Uncharacterized protein n=1 Tax=Oedothorax gibbosus TaxID=931172 RepID=A0AAV6W125_9ARAC|nr:hypothetical protein JTE90_012731 [Oedothorax gibbosus]